ncbi:testis-expressed protein 13B-like [Manis javanica]|uniref:testis-expressed protein 13B-like n=1 Tax=Manis javanica TaxID=9974 RepID=UPI003C6D9186
MAMTREGPGSGFQHSTVAAFINKKMAGHAKGPEFFLVNAALSWDQVEGKLKAVLEDSTLPDEAKEACAWSSLALGMRFAHKQGQLHRYRVQYLHDIIKLHKSAMVALAGQVKELTEEEKMEHKHIVFQLWQAKSKLAQVQRERDLLQWKIFQMNLQAAETQVAEEPGLASTSGAGTEGAGEKEDQAGTAAATVTTAGAEGGGKLKDAERAETTKEPAGDPAQLPGAVEQNIHTSGRQREGDLRGRMESCNIWTRWRQLKK